LVKKIQPNLAELAENLAGKNWRKKLAEKIGGKKCLFGKLF
jgi:hypothetical protein